MVDNFDWRKELQMVRRTNKDQPNPEIDTGFLKDLQERLNKHTAVNTVKKENKPLFVQLSTIAIGAFGSVYRIYQENVGLFLAKKTISKRVAQKHTANIFNEVKLQLWLNHPNIISLYHVYSDEDFVHLIMELGCGNNLSEMLHKNRPSVVQIRFIIKQLLEALAYLHKNEIVHRDIKPQNIIVDLECQIVKLCDFGFAYHRDWQGNECMGTVEFMAPQMVSGRPYNRKVDVWAVGAILFEMVRGKPLVPGKDNTDKYMFLNNFKESSIDYGEFKDPQLRDFLRRMLDTEPSNRSECSELLLHSWLIH